MNAPTKGPKHSPQQIEARVRLFDDNYAHAANSVEKELRAIISSTWENLELFRAQRDELLAALRKSEEEFSNLDENAPVDSGCIECTSGTVPNDKNTGLCAHHMRVAVLAKVLP